MTVFTAFEITRYLANALNYK